MYKTIEETYENLIPHAGSAVCFPSLCISAPTRQSGHPSIFGCLAGRPGIERLTGLRAHAPLPWSG